LRRITGIEPVGMRNLVDIEVDDVNCFYANGCLVHNSREPVWMNAFLSGGDPHKETAIKMWGAENYDKDKRKMAKGFNFGVLYGMSYRTVSEKYRISLEEADSLVSLFKKSLSTLFSWADRHCYRAKNEGTVCTFFGRPRRVRFWFTHPKASERGFGYRTAVNTVVQGTGSDILKWVVLRLWTRLLNHPDYMNDVRFMVTVHDEINFQVKKERFIEILNIIAECMRVKHKDWVVPMDIGVEIGNRWGETFPFTDESGEWRPKMEKVEAAKPLEREEEDWRKDFGASDNFGMWEDDEAD